MSVEAVHARLIWLQLAAEAVSPVGTVGEYRSGLVARDNDGTKVTSAKAAAVSRSRGGRSVWVWLCDERGMRQSKFQAARRVGGTGRARSPRTRYERPGRRIGDGVKRVAQGSIL